MIAFGFGIYQFLQYLSTKEPRQPLVSPQLFAVLLIVVGLTALGLAWFQHRQAMRTLRTEFGHMPYSIAGVTAAFIAGLGVVALLGWRCGSENTAHRTRSRREQGQSRVRGNAGRRAARLVTSARPGEILASQSLRDRLPGWSGIACARRSR